MSAECDCNTNSVKQCCKSEISKSVPVCMSLFVCVCGGGGGGGVLVDFYFHFY